MIEIKKKSDCCGCTACANACPKSCIEMIEDSEGFLYPVVNEEKCIKCNACEKVCPIINHVARKENRSQTAAIVQNKNKESMPPKVQQVELLQLLRNMYLNIMELYLE